MNSKKIKILPRVVTVGGGTGNYVSLMGLKKYDLELSAIVNMFDDGGSTGVLRDELGVLPPGDVRQCLVALSKSSKTLRELFNYRFEEGGLKGHTFGNIFLSALEKQSGSMKDAIREVGNVLRIRGQVVPVTFTKNAKLCVDLLDGKTIVGETHIDEVEKKEVRAPIKNIYIKPKAKLNKDVLTEIKNADFILIGPGDLYTSVLPNILVDGVPRAIKNSNAKKIFVVNLMTKRGHTTGFGAKKHVSEMEKYLGEGVLDYIVINSEKPSKSVLLWYSEYEETPVKDDLQAKNYNYKVVKAKLLNDLVLKQNKADARRRSIVRHDSDKLAKIIVKIIEKS